MRKAFSMITAIIVVVLMATVAGFILNLSGKMVKGTTAQFQREQSMLLAKSYTEYAIMAVTANEQNLTTCLNDISGNDGGSNGYSIDVKISYIGNGLSPAKGGLHANCRTLSNIPGSAKSPLTIIIDAFVRYPDPDNPNDINITYHRRSLQKI